MVVENLSIDSSGRGNFPTGKTCHDLQKYRGMIFRLRLPVHSLDADTLKHLPKARERAPMQKTREIVRRIGQQLAATESNEQREMLTCRDFCVGPCRSLRERSVRKAQRTQVPAQFSQAPEQWGIGTARQQGREQRIFLRPCQVDLIDSHLGKAPP